MTPPPSRALERTVVRLGAYEVGVTTYLVGTRWACRVDNVDPGAIIARASGATREEAVEVALASASIRLGMREAAAALQQSVAQLKNRGGR